MSILRHDLPCVLFIFAMSALLSCLGCLPDDLDVFVDFAPDIRTPAPYYDYAPPPVYYDDCYYGGCFEVEIEIWD